MRRFAVRPQQVQFYRMVPEISRFGPGAAECWYAERWYGEGQQIKAKQPDYGPEWTEV